MTVLRVLLDAAPAAERAEAWALFDAAGACVRKGRDVMAAWPAADRTEVVVAASQARIATVTLPPMPHSRVASAAAFALEDQLAGPHVAHHIAASTRSPAGHVRVAIVARALLDGIADRCPNVARIVAECDLAVPANDWRWCAQELKAAGFVRRPDGSAFPTDPPSVDGALPAELSLALQQARRSGALPARVRVELPMAAAFASSWSARWARECGVEFVPGAPWQWEAAGPAAFADAVELLPSLSEQNKAMPHVKRERLFAPALMLAAAALALHVVASSIEWASLRLQASRDEREWMSLAATAGVSPDAAATPAAARMALSRRYAQMRHDHGLAAPDDALPLLARAAAALATLPPGSVKRAAYADGHWTLELALANPAAIGELELRMRNAGVPALMAPSPSGVRMRIGGS
jgi:type II secretion system protein L